MILNIFKISENFIFKKLNTISHGNLILENYNGENYSFGNKESILKAKIKVNNKKFYFNILRGGSNALAESYIKNDFETPNLPSLIELTAKNIEVTHKFSGIINISSLNNFLEKFFFQIPKRKVLNIFQSIMI